MRIVVGNAGLLGGEATGTGSGKCMADTVEPVHTSKHQQTDKQSGYAGIDTPNPFGGDTDTG